MVRREAFYARLRFGQDDTEKGRAKAAALAAKVAAAPEVERHEVTYIPRERLPSALSRLKTGDVCLIIRRCQAEGMKPWLDCRHMGIIVRRPGVPVGFVHATLPQVHDDSLTTFIDLLAPAAGVKVLRIKDVVFWKSLGSVTCDPALLDQRVAANKER